MDKTLRFARQLRGSVVLPSSKSLSNRALVIGALAGEHVAIGHLSAADDTRVLEAALQAATGTVHRPETVDIGAAGTAMRFCTAYFATRPGCHLLTGSPRMQRRPIGILVDALRSLGAELTYAGAAGYPPLLITGRELAGGTVSLPAGVSSQYVSALLLVAPTLRNGLRLLLTGEVASRPYIDMTLALMRHFGAEASWTTQDTLDVRPRPYDEDTTYDVEPDWSAASYWYELVALSPDAEARIFLPRLSADSWQGDAAVSRLFEPLGVRTTFQDGGALLTKGTSAPLPLDYDFTRTPDLAQTLVVACAMLRRPFRFTGLHSLRIKETDRLAALQKELAKLGVSVDVVGDDMMRYDGNARPVDASEPIATYEDHRMAMAFAPCALRHPDLCIRHAEVVSKSYPLFWGDLAPFLA